MFPWYKKIGIEFFNSDLNVKDINESNFLVVQVWGTLKEKVFEVEKDKNVDYRSNLDEENFLNKFPKYINI